MSLKTVYPCFPPISRGVPSVLKFDPKRTSLIYANGLTVVIKNVADPTQVQTYTGHQYPVTAVTPAPTRITYTSLSPRARPPPRYLFGGVARTQFAHRLAHGACSDRPSHATVGGSSGCSSQRSGSSEMAQRWLIGRGAWR